MIAAGLMLAITAIKLAALFHFTGFYWDIWAKTNRALLRSRSGPRKFTIQDWPVERLSTGSVYLLWLSGWIGKLIEPTANGFRVIVETPPLIADLLIGLTLYFAVWRDGRGMRALLIMMLFALNPALIFDTPSYGVRAIRVVALPMIGAAILILTGPLSTRMERGGESRSGQAASARVHATPLALWTLFTQASSRVCGARAQFPARLCWSSARTSSDTRGTGSQRVQGPGHAIQRSGRSARSNFHGLIGGMGTPTRTQSSTAFSYSAFRPCDYLRGLPDRVVPDLRARSARGALLAIFVAMFGFFMFAAADARAVSLLIRWYSDSESRAK